VMEGAPAEAAPAAPAATGTSFHSTVFRN
jgi:hypothetical protein